MEKNIFKRLGYKKMIWNIKKIWKRYKGHREQISEIQFENYLPKEDIGTNGIKTIICKN